VEVVASLSQGRTAAAQCGLFTHKSVPVIFEPPCRWTVQNNKIETSLSELNNFCFSILTQIVNKLSLKGRLQVFSAYVTF